MLKNRVLIVISTVMLFIPWTLLPLRIWFRWAAEHTDVMIPCYAAFMIFSGIFTILSYFQANAQSKLMRVCLVVNSLYASMGVAVLGLIIYPEIPQ